MSEITRNEIEDVIKALKNRGLYVEAKAVKDYFSQPKDEFKEALKLVRNSNLPDNEKRKVRIALAQGRVAYENWLECEKEIEKLKNNE